MSPSATPHGYPYPLGTDRLADGDESIRDLALAVDTKLGVYANGVVTIPVVAAQTQYPVVVTYPVGRFPTTPACVVTVRSANPNVQRASQNNGSATGVTIRGYRDSGTATFDVQWLAVLAP